MFKEVTYSQSLTKVLVWHIVSAASASLDRQQSAAVFAARGACTHRALTASAVHALELRSASCAASAAQSLGAAASAATVAALARLHGRSVK